MPIPRSLLLAGALIAALPIASASAQTINSGPNVIVDLSVLGGPPAPGAQPYGTPPGAYDPFPSAAPGGYNPFPSAPPASFGDSADYGLLNPPAQAPRSGLTDQAAALLQAPAPAAAPAAPVLTRPAPAPAAPAPAPAAPAPAAAAPALAAVTPEAPAAPEPPPAPEPPAPAPAAEAPAPPPPAPAPEPPAPAPAPEPPAPEPPAPAPEPPAPEPPAPAPEPPAPEPPAPAPAAEAPPAPQVAALTPGDGQQVSVPFESGSAKLPDAVAAELERLAGQLAADDSLRIQLLAYAEGTAETASQARRLSLSRALAVRSFLIEQGVRSTRMDVRALGNKVPEGPADRVDVVLVQR